MLNKLRTMLKNKLRRSKTPDPVPILQDINKVLHKVADKQDRLAERQARWEDRQTQQEDKQAQWEDKEVQWQNRHAKLNDALDKIGEQLGGVTNNLGKINEAFFRHALANERPVMIGKVPFNIILADQTYEANDKAMQCDLVLVNTKYIAIIEAKHYLHPNDVSRFDAKLRRALPDVLPAKYRHLQLIPAMACQGLSSQAEAEIQKYGFVLFRPRGERARIESAYLRIRPPIIAKKR